MRGATWLAAGCLTLITAPAAPAAVQQCIGGMAGGFACDGVDLLAQVPLSAIGGGNGNDIWGWTDPVTGKEYALMGRTNGTAFVDISDPENPVYVGNLPTQTFTSSWRDIKVYADHAYVVADSAGSHGMQVFDLTRLRNVTTPPQTFTPDAVYNGFGSAHNVAINETTGFAYAVDSGTCANGLHMIDLADPKNPVFAGCHSADGSIHDAQCVSYAGPDPDHQGKEICVTATLTGDTMDIIDVTDKGATVTLSKNGYPGALTPHQGWFTEDHRYVLFGDESDETSLGFNTTTYVFDVTDLDNPVLTGQHTGPLPAIDHNQYVRGGHTYQANYTIGLRVLELTDLASATLTEVAWFDTRPETDAASFQGAWSVYPFFASCSVVVSDIQRGLFVLRPSTLCDCGNGVSEGSEECDGADFGGATCGDFGCTGGSLTCTASCTVDISTCTGCGLCDFDGLCEAGEDCNGCPTDCISGTTAGAVCGNGVCEAADGEDCLSCAADCNGKQNGKPANRFCCGDGDGQNPLPCSNSACSTGGWSCTDTPQPPVSYCCGDATCEGDEDSFNCEVDCGPPPVCGNDVTETGEVCDGTDLGGETCVSQGCTGGTLACLGDCSDFDTSGCTGCCVPTHSKEKGPRCSDGLDNDCDGLIDGADPDC